MSKEVISSYQGINMIIMFIIGSAIVLGSGAEAKQDIWIAMILAILAAVPFVFIYARLLKLFPGKDLFDILQELFGKFLGKAIALLYVWYAFHLGALVIRNFSEFIQIAAMPETPQYIIVLFLGVICIWSVKEGIEVMGRWSAFVFPLVFITILFMLLASLSNINIMNIKPVLNNGLGPVITSAFGTFAFPFAEMVVFTMVVSGLKDKKSIFKVFLIGLAIGGALLISAATRNILVLGVDISSGMYFPSYSAIRTLQIDEMFQRIEVLVAVVLTLGGIVKISVCLYAASNGLAKVFNIGNHRRLAVAVGLLMMEFSMAVYTNVMEMFDWAFKIYKYYALPFQVIIPVIVLIAAQIKLRSKREAVA